jgi:replicative DNA helicase
MSKELDSLSKAPIYINDTAAINIFEFRAQCRRLKSAHNIELVMIDYLQLMSGVSDNMKGGNREQEISNISRSLKSIAKELEIPVIALSQLSRAVETRAGDKRPQLSDLRESGAIEQDADMVMALYRPEYYNFTEDSSGNSTAGVAEVILLKNRHGGTEDIKLRFRGEYAKFEDIQEYNYSQYSSMGNPSSFEVENNYKTVQSKINDSDGDAF